jgi:polysaccharide deacetylase family protein (PEP-CTERM system associated)
VWTSRQRPRVNALSFDIEDWFHLVDIDALEDRSTWDSRESIVEVRTDEILATLDRHGVKATFFVLGWIADRYPALVQRIADAGHEIGSHSYWHRPVYTLTQEQFREDTIRSLDAIERACGIRPICYRAPSFSIIPGCEWAFDILTECGIEWDSSLFPGGRGHGGYPCGDRPLLFQMGQSGRRIPELPLGLMRLGPIGVCFSGGGYFRLLPKWLVRAGFELHRWRGLPVVMYLHPRDFAPDCPRVPMPLLRRFKSYVGLGSTAKKLDDLLCRYQFAPCGDILLRAGLLAPRHPTVVAAKAQQTVQRIRVLLLNQVFWPDVAATAQHAFDLAKYLHAHGFKVSAIASRSIYGHAGSVLPSAETTDGVEIHRVAASVFGKKGIASRSFDFVSFNITCLFKAFALPRHDVVICLTTPPLIALIGLFLRWTKGTRFVFWTMDLYPDVPLAAGVIKPRTFTHRLFDRLDRFCLHHADAVVVLGRCMRDRILAKGVEPSRITVINPWANPDEVLGTPARRFGPEVEAVAVARGPVPGSKPATLVPNAYRVEWEIGDRFVIEYSGNCGVGHDVSTVCNAMLDLRDDDEIRWVIVGGGVARPRIQEFIAHHDIRNVVMKPYQPRKRLGELIALGDVHLVLVADGFEGLLLPSKFYGVMAASRPTLYVGPSGGEVAQVISDEKCGYVIKNGDSAMLVRSIRELQREPTIALSMGLRGRLALERSYSMQIACAQWIGLIDAVAGRRDDSL